MFALVDFNIYCSTAIIVFQSGEVQLLAVSHWGVHLVRREPTQLHVVKSVALAEIGSCTAPRPTSVSMDGPQGRLTLYTPRAQQLAQMVNKFCTEHKKVSGIVLMHSVL